MQRQWPLSGLGRVSRMSKQLKILVGAAMFAILAFVGMLGVFTFSGALPVQGQTYDAGDSDTDRAALVALYNATDGANWHNNGNWLSNAPMGEWHGVTTDSDGRVTQLILDNNQLTGGIPAELGSLTKLDWLYLSGNQLSGEVPSSLGSLANLQWLHLDGNQLSGEIPAELGSLTDLEALFLSGNQLSGEIPAELGSLTNLEELRLNSNQLSRDIPAELGSLTNLEGLHLDGNQLSGEIPAELGSLTNLEELRLNSNQLSGEIPAELGSLANLQGLHLDGNQLSGEIPAELGSLTDLEALFLSGNQLTGCIPVGIAGVANNDFNQLGLPFCAGASGAPTIGTLTPGADFLTITWAAPTGSSESAIIAYDLRYIESAARDKSDVNWTVVDNAWTAGSGTLSYQIAGLTDGTQYDVQVRAVSAAGDGPWSATAQGTPATWGGHPVLLPAVRGPGRRGCGNDHRQRIRLVWDCDGNPAPRIQLRFQQPVR